MSAAATQKTGPRTRGVTSRHDWNTHFQLIDVAYPSFAMSGKSQKPMSRTAVP